MDSVLFTVNSISSWLWGLPMLIILAGGAIVMSIYLGFFQFRYFPFIMKYTFGNLFEKPKNNFIGTISGFKAMLTALAVTLGSGNIVGVGVAIGLGGPGAIFWMWICGMFASSFKYAEIVIGMKYRVLNEKGEYVGGPMYYLGSIAPWFGKLYALIFMFELIPSVANQAAGISDMGTVIGVPKPVFAFIIAVLIILIVHGGVRRIADVMNAVIPSMTILYFVAVIIIVIMNIQAVPSVISLIFTSAFTGTAAVGGFTGAVFSQGLRWGLARGVSSNDAGTGQSSIGHASALIKHPGEQGVWGVFEVVLDTLIICSLTAVAILVTDVWKTTDSQLASTLAGVAFKQSLGVVGGVLINIITFLFSMTTIIVIIYYGERLVEYLFKGKGFLAKYVYTFFVILGAFNGVNLLIHFVDIFYAGIIIPNVIGLFILRKEIKSITIDYFTKYRFDKKID